MARTRTTRTYAAKHEGLDPARVRSYIRKSWWNRKERLVPLDSYNESKKECACTERVPGVVS